MTFPAPCLAKLLKLVSTVRHRRWWQHWTWPSDGTHRRQSESVRIMSNHNVCVLINCRLWTLGGPWLPPECWVCEPEEWYTQEYLKDGAKWPNDKVGTLNDVFAFAKEHVSLHLPVIHFIQNCQCNKPLLGLRRDVCQYQQGLDCMLTYVDLEPTWSNLLFMTMNAYYLKTYQNTHLYQPLPACVWQCMVWNVFLPKLLQAKPRSQSTVVSFSPSGTRWWLRCSWKHSLPRSDLTKAKERRKALLEHRYSSLIHLYWFDLIFIQ